MINQFTLFCSLLTIFTFQNIPMQIFLTSVKGAKNEKELSRTIFNSLQTNDFSTLENYIPGEAEITHLKNTSTKINKPIFDPLNAETLRDNTKNNFEEIIRKGIEKEINWAGIQLSEHKITKCYIDQIGCTVNVIFQDPKGNTFNISYDLVKIKQRWFLFQGIRAE